MKLIGSEIFANHNLPTLLFVPKLLLFITALRWFSIVSVGVQFWFQSYGGPISKTSIHFQEPVNYCEKPTAMFRAQIMQSVICDSGSLDSSNATWPSFCSHWWMLPHETLQSPIKPFFRYRHKHWHRKCHWEMVLDVWGPTDRDVLGMFKSL